MLKVTQQSGDWALVSNCKAQGLQGSCILPRDGALTYRSWVLLWLFLPSVPLARPFSLRLSFSFWETRRGARVRCPSSGLP